MDYKLSYDETKRVITISNDPLEDGYVAAFDINYRANKTVDPDASRVYDWLADRLDALQAQITEAPERRGKLRKRADVEILAELIEEELNRGNQKL